MKSVISSRGSPSETKQWVGSQNPKIIHGDKKWCKTSGVDARTSLKRCPRDPSIYQQSLPSPNL